MLQNKLMNRTTDAIYEHLRKNKDTVIYKDLLAKNNRKRLSLTEEEIFKRILNETFEIESLNLEDFKRTVQSKVTKEVVM